MIATVREDQKAVHAYLASEACDPAVKALLTSDKFKAQSEAKFDASDKDHNQKLTADEIVPVVMALSKDHESVVVTEDLCHEFLGIFDATKTGALNREEFCDFMQFLYVMVTQKNAVEGVKVATAA